MFWGYSEMVAKQAMLQVWIEVCQQILGDWIYLFFFVQMG